ncbi:MAG: biotin/lipoyl-containing protein, partial [Clostridia bacterium]
PAAAPVSGGEKESAPMPGTILDVKVAQGASFKKGDVLLILEAMKMENEIMAPRDGVVKQIVTTKGASVNSGDTLMVIG